jgi:hypothetical protein
VLDPSIFTSPVKTPDSDPDSVFFEPQEAAKKPVATIIKSVCILRFIEVTVKISTKVP